MLQIRLSFYFFIFFYLPLLETGYQKTLCLSNSEGKNLKENSFKKNNKSTKKKKKFKDKSKR